MATGIVPTKLVIMLTALLYNLCDIAHFLWYRIFCEMLEIFTLGIYTNPLNREEYARLRRERDEYIADMASRKPMLVVSLDIETSGSSLAHHSLMAVGLYARKHGIDDTDEEEMEKKVLKTNFYFKIRENDTSDELPAFNSADWLSKNPDYRNRMSEVPMGFEPRCWFEFWSKNQALYGTITEECQKCISIEQGLKEMMIVIDGLYNEYDIIWCSDNPTFDFSFVDYYLARYLGRLPLRYSPDGEYRPVICSDSYGMASLQNAVYMCDNNEVWHSSKNVHNSYNNHYFNNKHREKTRDHIPANDAEAIWWDFNEAMYLATYDYQKMRWWIENDVD